MLGLNRKDALLLSVVFVLTMCAPFFLNPFPEGSAMAQFNAGYPDLMQRFVIFGIFAIGFNILFGLTGYLSFGHAAFLGVGSYAAIWTMKLLTMNVVPAIIFSVIVAGLFSLIVGWISLRRTGIYFSILTLAFAMMSFQLAYSVLTPITGGETGLQPKVADGRSLDTVWLRGKCSITGSDKACAVVSLKDLVSAKVDASEADLADELAERTRLEQLAEGTITAEDTEKLAALKGVQPLSRQLARREVVELLRVMTNPGDETAASLETEFLALANIEDPDIKATAVTEMTAELDELKALPPEALEEAVQYVTNVPSANLFGLSMKSSHEMKVGNWLFTFNAGFYVAAVVMMLAFYLSIRIFRSPFGMMLRAVKSNQQRLNYTGLNTKPYTLAAFVISGMYAGLAGGLLVAMDTQVGPERMFWTASGEVVLMSILGGAGTLIGPILGAGAIKYMENILSKINKDILYEWFAFMPDWMTDFFVTIVYPFIGKGWHLTLGLIFMLVVIFLPGGLVEGGKRIGGLFSGKRRKAKAGGTGAPAEPAE